MSALVLTTRDTVPEFSLDPERRALLSGFLRTRRRFAQLFAPDGVPAALPALESEPSSGIEELEVRLFH